MRFLTNAFLISKGKYKDFQIYAGFWVGNNANSGIFIRCEDPQEARIGAKRAFRKRRERIDLTTMIRSRFQMSMALADRLQDTPADCPFLI